MRTYLENIKKIKEFYNSDFFVKEENNNNMDLRKHIKSIYKDPDKYDSLIKEKAKELSDKEIVFKADGICGWKVLFDVYDGKNNSSWVDKYEHVRGSKYGEFFWPGKIGKGGGQTINQQRYAHFKDRIDWTLFDIKLYIEGKDTIMSYENEYIKKYFEKFKSKSDGFKNFIDSMELGVFVNENYDVFDLSKDKESIITEESKYHWSDLYLDKLVEICKKYPK